MSCAPEEGDGATICCVSQHPAVKRSSSFGDADKVGKPNDFAEKMKHPPRLMRRERTAKALVAVSTNQGGPMNYIGGDMHISSMDFAVVNETGRVTRRQRIETSERGLIECVRSVRAPRVLVIEEGTLAGWVKDVMDRIGEHVVVTDPKRNKWIGSAESKNDRVDAEKLAQLQRGGYTKEVVHLTGSHRRFRELVRHYHDTVKSATRVKNKLKAKFRQNGIKCTGETVYQPKHYSEWMEKLPMDEHLRFQVKGLMQQTEFYEGQVEEVFREIKAQGKKMREVLEFRKIAGIDWVIACTISGLVGDMRRFSNKRKFWKYCGLDVVRRSSGKSEGAGHLGGEYNRQLKWAVKTAASVAIAARDNPFRRQYLRLTLEEGMLEHRALLTVTRSLAATVYAIWKKGVAYDPELRGRVVA